MLLCVLIHVYQFFSPEHEQQVALETLGKVMSLVPLTLLQMIKLNSYCSTSHQLLPPTQSTTTPKTIFTRNSNGPSTY